jgi:hypothetical protein
MGGWPVRDVNLCEKTNRDMRWVVGADQAERMHMRHETSEAEYNDWTWSQLGPSR